jgi:hypothetical protein
MNELESGAGEVEVEVDVDEEVTLLLNTRTIDDAYANRSGRGRAAMCWLASSARGSGDAFAAPPVEDDASSRAMDLSLSPYVESSTLLDEELSSHRRIGRGIDSRTASTAAGMPLAARVRVGGSLWSSAGTHEEDVDVVSAGDAELGWGWERVDPEEGREYSVEIDAGMTTSPGE